MDIMEIQLPNVGTRNLGLFMEPWLKPGDTHRHLKRLEDLTLSYELLPPKGTKGGKAQISKRKKARALKTMPNFTGL